MHSPFRHIAPPQMTTPLLAAQGHDLTDDWSLPSAHFVDSWCLFQCSFGSVLLLNQIYLTTMCLSITPLRFILSVCSGN